MKMIGAKLIRGHRVSLSQVGSAVITSRLLYGMGLVSRGGQTVTKILTPMYNRVVRYASGAFVTSPIIALMAEAGTLPFHLIVLQHIVRLAVRLLEQDSEMPISR